ncbi:MAG: cold shock domain-containing protein [Bacteroidota bacterium]|jgi:cold shock protein
MSKGKVKFYNEGKGFGFITEDGTGTESFFHVSSLKDDVSEGSEVTYDLEKGKKGLNAVNVKLA